MGIPTSGTIQFFDPPILSSDWPNNHGQVIFASQSQVDYVENLNSVIFKQRAELAKLNEFINSNRINIMADRLMEMESRLQNTMMKYENGIRWDIKKHAIDRLQERFFPKLSRQFSERVLTQQAGWSRYIAEAKTNKKYNNCETYEVRIFWHPMFAFPVYLMCGRSGTNYGCVITVYQTIPMQMVDRSFHHGLQEESV